MWEADGRTWARDDDTTFEVLHLDRALEAALAGPPVGELRIDDARAVGDTIFVAR